MDLSCSLKREVEKKKKKVPPFSLIYFILFYFQEKSLKRQPFPGGSLHQKKIKNKKMDIVKLFKGSMNRFFRKTRQWCQLEMFALGVS